MPDDEIGYHVGSRKYTMLADCLKDGVSYAPVRGVTEALGAEVQWNQADRTVIITKTKQQ